MTTCGWSTMTGLPGGRSRKPVKNFSSQCLPGRSAEGMHGNNDMHSLDMSVVGTHDKSKGVGGDLGMG